MKIQFILVAIIAISLNAYPFLRNLAADTEESCKAEGKDYEITKSAQCKAGDKTYNVTSKDECKSGTWEEGSCTISKITEKTKCTGTPTYTAATTASSATCKIGEISITDTARLASRDACEVALVYDSENQKCSVDQTELNENGGTACSGTPQYTDAVTASPAKCTLGSVEIDETDETKCKATLVKWTEGSCKGNTKVTVKEICNAKDPEFTEGTGKCVEKANSNSFLSFKFALLLVVYLLF